MKWVSSIGESTHTVVLYILNNYDVEKQALNVIFTLKKLDRHYTVYEIERACKDVLAATNRPTVKSIQTIIKSNKKDDEEKLSIKHSKEINQKYGFTRGASYYGGRDK